MADSFDTEDGAEDGDVWPLDRLIELRDAKPTVRPTLWIFSVNPVTNQKSAKIWVAPSADLEDIEGIIAERFGSGPFGLGLRTNENRFVKGGQCRIYIPLQMAEPYQFIADPHGRQGVAQPGYAPQRGGGALTQADVELAVMREQMKNLTTAQASPVARETPMDKMMSAMFLKLLDNMGEEKSSRADVQVEAYRSGMSLMKEIHGERASGDMQTEIVKAISSLTDKVADAVISSKTKTDDAKQIHAGASHIPDRTTEYKPPPKHASGTPAVEADEIVEADEETLKALAALLRESIEEEWDPARTVYDIVHRWSREQFLKWLENIEELMDRLAELSPDFKATWLSDKVRAKRWFLALMEHLKAQGTGDGTSTEHTES